MGRDRPVVRACGGKRQPRKYELMSAAADKIIQMLDGTYRDGTYETPLSVMDPRESNRIQEAQIFEVLSKEDRVGQLEVRLVKLFKERNALYYFGDNQREEQRMDRKRELYEPTINRQIKELEDQIIEIKEGA